MNLVSTVKRMVVRYTIPARRRKVFCVGYMKTGTTSFGRAMRRLGYKHQGFDRRLCEWRESGQYHRLIRYAERYESFDDFPWSSRYLVPHLAESFPDALFVLTIRDEASWTSSFHRFRKARGKTETLTDAKAIEIYRRHNDAIKGALANSDRLLIMKIIDGDGYEVLCPFLGIPVIDEPFPHANKNLSIRDSYKSDEAVAGSHRIL